MDERYLIRITVPPWFTAIAALSVLWAALPSDLREVVIAHGSFESWEAVASFLVVLLVASPPLGWLLNHVAYRTGVHYKQAPRPGVKEELLDASPGSLKTEWPSDTFFVLSFYSSAPQNVIDWVIRRRTHYVVALGSSIGILFGATVAFLGATLASWAGPGPFAVLVAWVMLACWIVASARSAWAEADSMECLWFAASRDDTLRDLLLKTRLLAHQVDE